jgi:hypothetical protein
LLITFVLLATTVGFVFALSKQDAKKMFMGGYNDGYDVYDGPYGGQPNDFILMAQIYAQLKDAALPGMEKLAIANLYIEGYRKGWSDHSRGIHNDAYRAWDNTRWALYGGPYGL